MHRLAEGVERARQQRRVDGRREQGLELRRRVDVRERRQERAVGDRGARLRRRRGVCPREEGEEREEVEFVSLGGGEGGEVGCFLFL